MSDLSLHRSRLLLAAILLGGFLLRLALSPAPGNTFDIGINQRWGKSAMKLGLARSYVEQVEGNMLPNHGPLSIMLFTGMAAVHRAVFSRTMETDHPAFHVLIKLPAIAGDIAAAFLLYLLLSRWRSRKTGLLAAAVYAVHPAVLYDSAIWGQTDVLPALCVLLAIGAVVWDLPFVAGLAAAAALLLKAQPLSLLPVVALGLLARPRGIPQALAGGLLIAVPILLPFLLGGTLEGVRKVYTDSVGYYPVLSSVAYNFWWTLFGDAAGDTLSTDLLFGLLQYRLVGLLLFAAAGAWALRWAWPFVRSSDSRMRLEGMLLAGAAIAYAFFLFNTEMHERYLFPFVLLGIPLLFLGRVALTIYLAGSVAFLFNMFGYLQYGWLDRLLYATFPAFDGIVAHLHVLTFAFLIWWMSQHPLHVPLMTCLIRSLRFPFASRA